MNDRVEYLTKLHEEHGFHIDPLTPTYCVEYNSRCCFTYILPKITVELFTMWSEHNILDLTCTADNLELAREYVEYTLDNIPASNRGFGHISYMLQDALFKAITHVPILSDHALYFRNAYDRCYALCVRTIPLVDESPCTNMRLISTWWTFWSTATGLHR